MCLDAGQVCIRFQQKEKIETHTLALVKISHSALQPDLRISAAWSEMSLVITEPLEHSHQGSPHTRASKRSIHLDTIALQPGAFAGFPP